MSSDSSWSHIFHDMYSASRNCLASARMEPEANHQQYLILSRPTGLLEHIAVDIPQTLHFEKKKSRKNVINPALFVFADDEYDECARMSSSTDRTPQCEVYTIRKCGA